MYGLPDGDLWKIKACWRRNFLIVKLHIDILHLIAYSKMVCGYLIGPLKDGNALELCWKIQFVPRITRFPPRL
jgi:hypothetical protein